MSELRIDVTWRGLEVGRQVPLHSVTDGSGRLDVPQPMPVGSALALRTADGREIPAVVTRVHEQSSAGGETAGMVVTPALDEASRAWWAARAEESAAAVPEPAASTPDDEPAVMIVAPADPTARPTMVFTAVKLSDVPAVPATSASTSASASAASSPGAAPAAAPAATPAWRTASAPGAASSATTGARATTAPGVPPAPFDTPTLDPFPAAPRVPAAPVMPAPAARVPAAPVMPAASAPVPAAPVMPAAAAPVPAAPVMPAAAADPPAARPAADEDAGTTRLMFGAAPPDDVPEDTSRTTVMAAVDVEAIMADGAAHAADVGGNGDDADASTDGTVGGEVAGEVSGEVSGASGPRGKGKGPRGKRRRSR